MRSSCHILKTSSRSKARKSKHIWSISGKWNTAFLNGKKKKKSKFVVSYNQLVPKVIYVHLQLALCFIYVCVYTYTHTHTHTWLFGLSRLILVEKNPSDNTEDKKDMGLILQWSRSSGGGHGNPLQYSCLENSMDRKAWWVTVHGVSSSHKETEFYNIVTLRGPLKTDRNLELKTVSRWNWFHSCPINAICDPTAAK